MNFWQSLPKPIIGLSPMDGVTDHPFRHITKKYGQPSLIYTEFTSVEGVCHGAKQLLKDFLYDEIQRPVIGQIYGTTPDFFRQSAIILCQLGFDGIDINMGCPAKNVAHSGAGAALIKSPKLAQEIIRQTKLGIEQWHNGANVADCPDLTVEIAEAVTEFYNQLPTQYQEPRLIPVSVKTRVGYDQPVIEEWIPTLLEMELAAITLHGRTLKQQYGGQASWELIGKAAELTHQTKTLLLGNGDVKSLQDAKSKIATFNTDGILIGRGAMGNPFVFRDDIDTPDHLTLFKIALEHAQLYEKTYGHEERYNFLPMRKHLGWYVHDIPEASKIRQAIYRSNNSQEFVELMKQFGYQLS
jgi:tRNA-dihydrouridine synthase B